MALSDTGSPLYGRRLRRITAFPTSRPAHNANDEFTLVSVRPFCSQAFSRRGRILGFSQLRVGDQLEAAVVGSKAGIVVADVRYLRHKRVSVYWFCAINVRRLTCCRSGYSYRLSKPGHPRQMATAIASSCRTVAIWWRWGESNSRPDRLSPSLSAGLAPRTQQFRQIPMVSGIRRKRFHRLARPRGCLWPRTGAVQPMTLRHK